MFSNSIVGTKSQQALQLQREENKLERKVISREMKAAEKVFFYVNVAIGRF